MMDGEKAARGNVGMKRMLPWAREFFQLLLISGATAHTAPC